VFGLPRPSPFEWALTSGALIAAGLGLWVAATTGNAALGAGLVALATMAVILYQSVQTRRAVEVGAREAEASVAMLEEARRDRELAVRPFLDLTVHITTDNLPPVVYAGVRNVVNGPAINVRVLRRLVGEVLWNDEFILRPGEVHPTLEGSGIPLTNRRGFREVDPALVGERPPDDLIAYCQDLLGNGLRFRLRTGEPPEEWRRGEAQPPWGTAVVLPFDWRTPADRLARPMTGIGGYRG
jgi:hypothetical protein